MAKLIASEPLDMYALLTEGSLLDLFDYGDVVTKTTSTFAVRYSDFSYSEELILTGAFSSYNGDYPATGTITGASYKIDGILLFQISALAMSVATFADYVTEDATIDLFRELLAGADEIVGSGGDDTLYGFGGNDQLAGSDGNDTLFGDDGNDSVSGGNGDDVLFGGIGNDRLEGGGGADTVIYYFAESGITASLAGSAAQETGGEGVDTLIGVENLVGSTYNDRVTGSAVANVIAGDDGNDIIAGYAGDDELYGDGGDDQLDGGTGADTLLGDYGDDSLTGGAGADSLDGGSGTDIYSVAAADDHASAEIHDSGWDGLDELRFTATTASTLTLFAGDTGIERIVIGTGTGTTAASSGSTANNVDARALGNAVTMVGNAGANTLTATAFDDLLQGGVGIDRLVGNGGNDTLDGGRDADKLLGGAGDDTYVVDNTSDAVIELAGEGTDTVLASVAVTLKANVERLVQTGIYSIHASGNELANAITGNSGSNKLYGLGGDDTLTGGAGNDYLDGGSGLDVLTGGFGNDSYVVDSLGDTLSEAAGEGYDLVKASLSWTLGGNFERLDLLGATAIDGTGNALANVLNGNEGANGLAGLLGNDKLYGRGGDDLVDGGDGVDWLEGGAGLDVMVGGAGGDRFVFRTGDFAGTTAGSCDVIRDYSYASGDRIRLDLVDANSTIAGTQDFAFIGTGAFTGVAGQLRYEQANGNTFVSADTDGDGDADLMLQLDGVHALKVADFIL
jgi:Ca2+-binding RTX toxin-like protein